MFNRPWANMLQSWIIGSGVPDFGSYAAKADNELLTNVAT